MANTFSIPLANPFRFTLRNFVPDPRYNTLPFDYKTDEYSYFQKWQTNDITKVQVLSDYTPTFEFFTCDDVLYKTVALSALPVSIQGFSFTCYEGQINFSEFDENIYYGSIRYIDNNNVVQHWDTSPLDIRERWYKTLLYEYTNTYNDKGVIFETGIVFNFRVEGLIREYTPVSSDELYEDQEYNTTTENSIPYRNFKNYIGNAEGLPDWVMDKMNIIYSLNTKSIDGTYYNKADGAKFEITRPGQVEREDGYASIEIIPQNNIPLQQYKIGDTPIGDLIVIDRAYLLLNISGNQTVAGVFNDFSNLVRIAIANKSQSAFTLLVGTTDGGNDIIEADISSDITTSLDIGHFFDATTTIYVTLPTGININLIFDYKQYNAPNLNSSTPNFRYPKGHLGFYYKLNDTQLAADWNISTGMGVSGGKYENCAIVGTNGLPDISGRNIQVWKQLKPDSTLNTVDLNALAGNANNQVVLTMDNLPAQGIGIFTDENNPTPGDRPLVNTPPTAIHPVASSGTGGSSKEYELRRGNAANGYRGTTQALGIAAPVDITQASFIALTFVAIND